MALIVEKFGGTSVADTERMRNVAAIIAADYRKENGVIAVISAQGDTTDELVEQALEIAPRPQERELDSLLSTGEQISVSKMAMLLCAMGVPAVSLCGWQAVVHTDSNHGGARIKDIDTVRIKSELDGGKVVIVAGFQGINTKGDITTIGRGGSDTTAVALAAVMNADVCKIYTDVDGVYSADPRIVKKAVRHYEIGYDEMLELASLGAQVLHNRAVEMAKRFGVKLQVLSSFSKGAGTKVREVIMEQKNVVGVARDSTAALITVKGLSRGVNGLHMLLERFAAARINVDMILKMSCEEPFTVELTIPKGSVTDAVEALCSAREQLGFSDFKIDDTLCKVSIVGAGMTNSYGIAAKMLEALKNEGIEASCITTSETKISILVPQETGERAVIAVHDAFF